MEPTTLTLAEFQRDFKKARDRAQDGYSVIVKGDGADFIFEKYVPNENPFRGMEHIFGPIRRFPKPKTNGHKTKKSHH